MVDFLVIGPETVVQYNNCFRLIRDHKMFYGFKRDGGHMVFDYIDGYEIDVQQIRWFQNLMDVPPDPLVLRKVYEDGGYRRFDDMPDVINVDRVEDIPVDYEGVIGVPITFYRHWNPGQFELLDMKKKGCVVDGVPRFVRLLIRKIS